MGDGIMALWGAPAHHPDDAVRSVQCALEQMEALGQVQPRSAWSATAAAGNRHRHPHGPARRGVRRELEGALVHGHRGHGEHERAPLRHRARRADHRERGDARAAREPLRGRGAAAREPEGQREAAPHLQREAREADRDVSDLRSRLRADTPKGLQTRSGAWPIVGLAACSAVMSLARCSGDDTTCSSGGSDACSEVAPLPLTVSVTPSEISGPPERHANGHHHARARPRW